MVMRAIAVSVVSLALMSCATVERESSPSAYRCHTSSEVAGGDISVVRWLFANGIVGSTVVLWNPSLPNASGLEVWGRWEARSPAVLDFNRGLVMFDRTFDRDFLRLGRPHRIELRAQAVGPWEGRAQLEGKFSLQSGLRLSADWADARAMARGADRLFLLTKDRRGNVLDQQPIDKSLFDGFIDEGERLLAETSEMAAEFQERCESEMQNGIIITSRDNVRSSPPRTLA